MMWDLKGSQSYPDGSRSPIPHFPIPHPGTPPDMSQSRSQYPTPFMPLGLSDVPPVRVHGSNPYPTYNTFPGSSPPHFEGSRLRMPSPIPTYTVQFPTSSRSPHHGHESSQGHTHHRIRTKSSETRRVHYADENPYPHGASRTIHVSSTVQRDRAEGSQQYRAIAVPVQTRQPNDSHRRRVNSTGSALPRSVTPLPAAQHQRSGRFEYSKCTGRKKAVCIGINYFGQKRQLQGCINDVMNVKRFLMTQWGYRDEDILMLRDDTRNPRRMPTRKNMIEAMRWLVKDARPHDSLFFHYSGHGGQIPDTNGDEIDGLNEVIYPVDYKKAGVIVDDEMHIIMVKPLPAGCRLTAIFDSCHSGTALDLPYFYQTNGRLKGNQVAPKARGLKASSADVISFTACRDEQTSVDTVRKGVSVGAMSYAFVTSLTQKPLQSYQQLLRSVREVLQQYEQVAQLSSSHYLDTNRQFIL